MAGEKNSKLNSLLKTWPPGTVAVVPWLEKLGVYQQLAYQYERAGWVKRVGRGAYTRLNDTVDWPGGVHAFQQQLGLSIHVGGKTALELKGLGHFAAIGEGAYLYLFGSADEKPPGWFLKHDWKRRVSYKMPQLFDGKPGLGLTSHSYDAFSIQISSPERAILEVLHLTPGEQSVEEALLLIEGLATLRPKLVQELLECCRSIKAKRLFLALAERCNHAWLKKLDLSKVQLGKGKRMIVSGGVLDPKYQITLPRQVGK
ncbi:MAG: type IV toxin-antitoxin system AbiEi family antitoxin [Deltaproteobacteria bacterium]|nr:type IV toxin-antitoxin system AbiEi family antitoxin [Deltaproteobacteria bacterium]